MYFAVRNFPDTDYILALLHPKLLQG